MCLYRLTQHTEYVTLKLIYYYHNMFRPLFRSSSGDYNQMRFWVWTTQSKNEERSLVKLRQTSNSLVQNVILCHIRNPKRLPTVNIELHPKS
jgi:hypothetical protein